MIQKIFFLIFFMWSIDHSLAQNSNSPDTFSVQSGEQKLKGLLWIPSGKPPFPAVIFCHGGYESTATKQDVVQDVSLIGPVFAKHGYIFLSLFRGGTGLSKGHGTNSADLMATALKEKGQEGRNQVQLQQLETEQLREMIAVLRYIRKRKDADTNSLAVMGHSFGGSLALLLAEHEPGIKTAVVFSAAGFSWERSPQLRHRLSDAVTNIKVPIMVVHAQNDYSVKPGHAFDSILNKLGRPHSIRIYPAFGNSQREAHNLIFLGITIWEGDVFRFLNDVLLQNAHALSSDASVKNGYAEVNGTTLYYEMAGKGEPLVLIHGSFGDRRFWDAQFSELSRKYKVVRYDIRGYGKSALPDSNELYRDTDDLKALLDFLQINKAHICGLSLGSFIVIDFGLAYPNRCLSLIPIGPRVAGDATDEYKPASADSIRTIIARTTQIVRSDGAKAATDYLWTGNHAMGRCIVSAKTRQAMLKMGYEYSWWRYIYPSKREFIFPLAIKKLDEIKIPTLIVTADHDLDLCKQVAAILAKGIAGAKLISIKNAGHMMNMDNPTAFNKEVSKFIDSLPRTL